MKTHWRSIGLYTNAGIDFPECYARAELLDLDKSRLPLSSKMEEVTCKNCRRAYNKSWVSLHTGKVSLSPT